MMISIVKTRFLFTVAVAITALIMSVMLLQTILFSEQQPEETTTIMPQTTTEAMQIVDWGEDKESLLVYYAVPKCGSTSFSKAMKVLSRRNGFTFKKEEADWRGFQYKDWSVQMQV